MKVLSAVLLLVCIVGSNFFSYQFGFQRGYEVRNSEIQKIINQHKNRQK